jgi:DNA invertase Pin-like site-specific DNA recombinase
MIIGYARVSTLEQNEALQTDALDKAGCERLFTDHASGAKAHRPELDRLLDVIREGDTLVVWKLDRLGRSVQNLVDLMNLLQSRGVGFRSLTENMDTTTPGGVLVFNVFAAMAQFERDLIRERTNAGLRAARARGHKGGRPSKLTENSAHGSVNSIKAEPSRCRRSPTSTRSAGTPSTPHSAE